jgi:hypothetical protein
MRTIRTRQAAHELRSIAEVMYTAAVRELPVALLQVEADIKQRVFLRGQDVDGARIGQYSTDPFYLDLQRMKEEYGSQLPLSRLKPEGKPRYGRKKGFTTRRYRGERIDLVSKYFPGGYAQFRKAIGRESAFVNWKLSGALERSIQSGVSQNVGVIGFTNAKRAEIAEKLQEKYGVDAIAVSNEEAARFYLRLQRAVIRAIP